MTQKAKRKLSEISFDHEGAHLALCSKSQGAANNWNKALIMKGHNFSPEFVQKMQAVQVTMELPDFLEKFFYVWGKDAEFLAGLMGWVEPPEDEVMEAKDDYNDWVEDRFQSFSIIKSLHESKSLPDALSKLTEQDYLDVLTDQVVIEKALKELAEKKADDSTKNVEKTKVEGSPSKKIKKEKVMTQAVDMVDKSELVAVEKALSDQKVALEKALAQVKQFEEAQKQAIVKSKTDAVNAVVKDEKQAAVIVKAALALDSQEDFEALVAVFKSMNEMIEKSDAFKELGVDATSTEDTKKNGVLEIIKAQQAKK